MKNILLILIIFCSVISYSQSYIYDINSYEDSIVIDNNLKINGDLTLVGSTSTIVRVAATSSINITTTDNTIVSTYSATGAVTITLPSATTCWNSISLTGMRFLIKDGGALAGTNNITVNRSGSDTIIDSATSQTSTVINSNGGAIWIQAISASQWIIY